MDEQQISELHGLTDTINPIQALLLAAENEQLKKLLQHYERKFSSINQKIVCFVGVSFLMGLTVGISLGNYLCE